MKCDWPCVMVHDMYEASNAGRGTLRMHSPNKFTPQIYHPNLPTKITDLFGFSFNFLAVMAMPEPDIIKTTFSFLSLLNANQIDILKPTEQLFCTMMAFLGKDCTFLEEEINSLLSTFVKNAFAKPMTFNLDDKFRGGWTKWHRDRGSHTFNDFALLQIISILKICTSHFWTNFKAPATAIRHSVF